MKHILSKEDFHKIKPWLIMIILAMTFYMFVSRFNTCIEVIMKAMKILKPLWLAIAFAYILNIPMMWIERQIKKRTKEHGFIHKRVRGIAVTLTIIFAIILLILIASIVFPKIIESLQMLLSNMGIFLKDIFDNIDKLLEFLNIDYRTKDIAEINNLIEMPWNEIFRNVINVLGKSANDILSNTMNVTSTFFTWFLAFMFSLYLLNGKETLIRQSRKVAIVTLREERAQSLFAYGHRANVIFKNFISGQLVEACIISVLYYIGMRIFQFPFPELIAVIIGLFSLVPVFGPMTAMCIGAFLVLAENFVLSFWFIVFFQIISQVEDNLIYPRVVGNSVGLPGLWVMLSIFILGDMFGIVGMITAVPLTAFVYTLFSEWVHQVLKRRHINVDEAGFVIDTSMYKEEK